MSLSGKTQHDVLEAFRRKAIGAIERATDKNYVHKIVEDVVQSELHPRERELLPKCPQAFLDKISLLELSPGYFSLVIDPPVPCWRGAHNRIAEHPQILKLRAEVIAKVEEVKIQENNLRVFLGRCKSKQQLLEQMPLAASLCPDLFKAKAPKPPRQKRERESDAGVIPNDIMEVINEVNERLRAAPDARREGDNAGGEQCEGDGAAHCALERSG